MPKPTTEDLAAQRIEARSQPRKLEYLEWLLLSYELEALALTRPNGFQPAVEAGTIQNKYYTPSGQMVIVDIPIRKHRKPFIHSYIQRRLLAIGIRMSYKSIRDVLDNVISPTFQTADTLTGQAPKRR